MKAVSTCMETMIDFLWYNDWIHLRRNKKILACECLSSDGFDFFTLRFLRYCTPLCETTM